MIKSQIIQRSKNILDGEPVFTGTRVPVQTLIDYWEAGDSIDDFLEEFPTVTRKQILEFLKLTKEFLLIKNDENCYRRMFPKKT